MEKIKLGVVFGGMSTENEVSIVSAYSILNNLDEMKYDIYPIYIDKDGKWWKTEIQNVKLELGANIENKKEIENEIKYLKYLDVVFPVLHGLYGEDGTIQGLFELSKIPYVGCKVLGSSIGMDKAYTKVIFEKAGLKQASYEYIRKFKDKYIYVDKNFDEKILSLDSVSKTISNNLKFPMFIKPSNSGSSVGINKAKNLEELKKHIEYAAKFDTKILVEQGIIGREVECAVLGNEDIIAQKVTIYEGHDRLIATGRTTDNYKHIEKFYKYISDTEVQNKVKLEATTTRDIKFKLRQINKVIDKLLKDLSK